MNVLFGLEERRAAASEARSTVENERWQALLGMLIDAEVVSPAEVADMCDRLAGRLSARDESAFNEAAVSAKNVARLCREVRCG